MQSKTRQLVIRVGGPKTNAKPADNLDSQITSGPNLPAGNYTGVLLMQSL